MQPIQSPNARSHSLSTSTSDPQASAHRPSQAPTHDAPLAMPTASPLAHGGAHISAQGFGLSRPSSPDIAQLAARQAMLRPTPPAFADLCHQQDALKAQWAEALRGTPNRADLARRLAAQVEVLHGKAGQSARASAVAQRLLADDGVQGLMAQAYGAPSAVQAQQQRVVQALGLVNLGEVFAPSALYLAEGRPTDDMRQSFAGRPARASAFVREFDLGDRELQTLVAQSHADAPRERPLTAQIVDVSERIAAMTAVRPQRPSMPTEKVAAIVTGDGERGLFDPALAAAAARLLRQGALTP